MKKNKVINIETNNDYIMWEVDTTDLGYDCILNVPIGVQGIYCENGAVMATFREGQYFNINPKKNKKSNVKIKIIATNSIDHLFEIKLAKTDIPYIDYEDEARILTEVAIQAGCKVMITDPYKLYAQIGNEFRSMTRDDLLDFLWKKLSNSLGSCAAKLLENESYITLTSKIGELSLKITDIFKDVLDGYGIKVFGDAWAESYFQDEYVAQRKQNLIDKAKVRTEKEKIREKMRINREEAEIINSLNIASSNNMEKKCPHCNLSVAFDAKFCAKCGKKI